MIRSFRLDPLRDVDDYPRQAIFVESGRNPSESWQQVRLPLRCEPDCSAIFDAAPSKLCSEAQDTTGHSDRSAPSLVHRGMSLKEDAGEGGNGSIILTMVINMNETQLRTIEQVGQFLSASAPIEFSTAGNHSERYEHISRVLKRFDWHPGQHWCSAARKRG